MYWVDVTIEGIAPILFHRMTEEEQESMAQSRTGGTRTVAQKRKEALSKVYRNGDGLFCPGENIKKALLQACTKASLKYGKKALYGYVEALVFIEPHQVSFGKLEPDFVDERVGRIPPRTGGRVIIYRPGLHEGWVLSFTLAVMDDRIPEDHLKRALDEAGVLVGLCDHRPEFGRFVVKKWETRRK